MLKTIRISVCSDKSVKIIVITFASLYRMFQMTRHGKFVKFCSTRLHSSRMPTARALTVSPSMLCGGGGVCSRGGCLLPGDVCCGGCLLWGVSTLGGVCSGGVSAPAGCGIPACTEADAPPCEQNHTRL